MAAPILDPGHCLAPEVRSETIDALAPELVWLAARGVEVRRTGRGVRSTQTAQAVIYLVDREEQPPPCGPSEDWVRVPIDRGDLLARAERLLLRTRRAIAPSVRVADGVVRAAGRSIVLARQEERLLQTLLDAEGQLVGRDALVAAVWPEGPPADPRALDNRVKQLRRRLAGIPLQIHTVRGRGLLIEVVDG